MPAFFAAAASCLPTSAACSLLSPLNDFFSATQDADASVLPVRSSTSCASMPRFDRNTTRRGFCGVPLTLPRTRLWRRSRPSLTVKLGTLAHLPAHVLALVANALALVGLRRANLANLGGRLADLLFVGALDHDLRRRGDLEADARPRLDRDGMGIADLQLEVGALERSAIADALDLEALLEALRHALDHVRDERAREPVEGAVLAALGRAGDDELSVALLDLHPRRHLLRQLAERPVHLHAAGRDGDVDARGNLDWPVSDSAHLPLATRRSRSLPRRSRAPPLCGS